MHTAAQVLVALVALIHIYFLVLEMFLWDTDRGRKAFGTTPEFSRESATLAANQGLYNGFMAAGSGASSPPTRSPTRRRSSSWAAWSLPGSTGPSP